MADLKPCPFCGCESIRPGDEWPDANEPVIKDTMWCDNCFARGPEEKPNSASAEDLWNQRVLTNPETGEPYFRIPSGGWGDRWEAGIALNARIECGGIIPGTVSINDWLDDGDGNLRDQFGKGAIVATVDYATFMITPITDS